MDPAFFGKVVPWTGLRRPPPPPNVRPVHPVYSRGPMRNMEQLPDGRHIETFTMRNSYEQEVQFGATTIYVVNDYGVMVPTECWGAQC